VSDVVRLALVSHAMTDAMAAGRFPADEPLNRIGRRQAKAAARGDLKSGTRQLAGPEQRAWQTAQLLGLRPAAEPRLADLDCGSWSGQTLRAVGPADLESWLTDPARAPHGGESIVDLIERVGVWLESLPHNGLPTVAVTHPAVIRAAILRALDMPPKSFWRIDVAPVSSVVMHFRAGRWTLRL
jgi:broad specificity phosphatase PhoE